MAHETRIAAAAPLLFEHRDAAYEESPELPMPL